MGRPRKEEAAIDETKVESKIDFSILDKAFSKIQKDLGTEVVIDVNKFPKIERIKARSPLLGYIMGDGGAPKGRVIEIFGKESSGKSLVATTICADAQAEGLFAAYIDMECAFSTSFAKKIGLDTSTDKFRLIQPVTGEDVFTVIEMLAESGQVGVAVVDSVAAMTPQAELEGEMTDATMALLARIMGRGFRKVTGIISRSKMLVIFVNQTREGLNPYGEKIVTPGGKALKFFSSIRLEINRCDYIKGKNEDDVIGIRAKVKSVKNKTAAPFRKGEIEIFFDKGINTFNEYVDFGITFGFIEKAGSWLTYKEERIQGKPNMSELLRNNDALFNLLKKEVDEKLLESSEAVLELPETEDNSNDSGLSIAEQALTE